MNLSVKEIWGIKMPLESKDYKNDNNEYTIGRLFMLWNYFLNGLKYAVVGGVVGYVIGRTWKTALVGALIAIIIRYIIISIIWKLIKILVDVGSK